ncbi:MAG: hypothetical protein WCJ25_01390, partial [Candidatus Moraniibacteriota bacterium]
MKYEIQNVISKLSVETPTPPVREASGDSINESGELQERLDAVRNWTRDVLESNYPKFEPLTENRFLDFCEEQGLARICRQETAEPVLPQKKGHDYFGWRKESYKESDVEIDRAPIEVYFDELIGLLERKAEENASDLSSFREETVNHETSNPWFGHRLETTKKIFFQARVWNNPAVRQAFTFPLSQEIANTLFLSDMTEIERIALGLKSASPGELLDVIQSLPVPPDPFYDEDEDGKEVPENTAARRNKFRFILETIAETDVPVIRFAARHELSEMEEHWDAIDADWLARYEPADSGLSELSSEQQTDAKRLRRKVLPDKGLSYGNEMLRTADDAITIYDENFMPQYIVRVPSETLDRILSSDGKTDWESLEISRTLLDRDKKPDNASIKWAIRVMKEKLLGDIDPSDTETLSEKFMSISSVLSQDQWKGLLDGLSEIETCSDEIEKAQNADQALFNERIDQEYKNIVAPIEARYSPEDSYLHPDDLSEDDKRTIETFNVWRRNEPDQHLQKNFDIRKAVRHERHVAMTERSVNDLLRVIRTDRDKFRRDILTFMDVSAEHAAATGELLYVKPVPYKHLVNDPSIVPFEKKDRDAASILRNLHTPSHADILGMDFSRLPLRAQVHFLLFRGKEDSAAAERFRLVLEKHPTLSDDIAYSFLATAEGSEYGETILSLAESLDTETLGPILKKYAEITKDADAVADFIRSEFPNLDETETASVAGTVTKNLLRRGRDLLVDFSKDTDTDHPSLLRKLDDISAGVELYKKTFRTLHESGKLNNPAEMANTEILTLSPEDLSEKDKEWMRGLYRKSYPESGYSSSFREAIFAGLDARVEKTGPGTRCHVLRRNQENVSFVFFEDTGTSEDGRTEKFGSSFNVEPEYRSDMVGGAFWDRVLAEESEGSIVTITGDHALPNPVSDFY